MIYRRRKKKPDVEKNIVKADCSVCKNAIFDEQWGEYKCKIHQVRIQDTTKILECEEFVKNYKK